MPADWMPGAVHRPISYRGAASRLTNPLGWILHVVVGNGSPYGIFENAPAGQRRFSHFWVSKTGVIEQYAETSRESWAQRAGNADYWSVETEGFPNEPLTTAQISSLARIHNFLGAADAIASKPGQKGIGTHYMGGAAWGGHTCPDPVPGAGPRSHQRSAIITAAKLGDTEVITPDDRAAIAHDNWAYLYNNKQVLAYLLDAAKAGPTADEIAAAVLAKLPAPATGGITADQVKQAVKDALKEGVGS